MAGSFIVTPVETGVQERVNLLKHWIPAFAGMTAKDGFSPFAIRPLRGASKRQAPGSAGGYDCRRSEAEKDSPCSKLQGIRKLNGTN